jgi:capsular exopolysaccharide synthesis family protein
MTAPEQSVDFDASDAPATSFAPGLLSIAWQRKSLLVLGLVVGVGAGALFYAQRTPVYESSAQILVVKKRPDALPIAGLDTARLSVFDDYVPTHLAILKSPLIAGRAVKKRQLESLASFAGRGDPTNAIIGALSVKRDVTDAVGSGSKILNLSYRGPQADDCTAILTAVIDSYKDFLDETYRDVSGETLDLITKARDILRKDLAEKEKAYHEFRQKIPVLVKGKGGTPLPQDRLLGIEARRSSLLVRQAELQGRLDAIQKALKGDDGPAARAALLTQLTSNAGSDTPKTNQQASPLQENLVGLLLQEKALLEDYGPDHPQVKAIRRRIEFTRDLLARPETAWGGKLPKPAKGETKLAQDPLDSYVQSLQQEVADNRVSLQSLQELFDREQAESKKLINYEMQEDSLRNDITRTQQLYDAILKRLQEVGLVKEAGGYDAQILSAPSRSWKVEPKAAVIVPIASFLGLLGGFVLAYVADRSDHSFRTPAEIRRRLGVPVIGHIPVLDAKEVAAAKAGGLEKRISPSLCCHHHPSSMEAEAYRAVRTALYFTTRGAGHKVIQITSPNVSDGKSTLTANLAVSIAQSGMRTIILDADFRRPTIHRLFGVSNRVGLTSVITGEVELGDAIQEAGMPGLAILPCGTRPKNPAELLMSPRFHEVLQALRDQYDYVLIDTPPLLAVTDPSVVAPRVDGVLLVLRMNKHGRTFAERATEVLATLGVTVFGVVVNGIGGRGKNSYYNNYYYSYGNSYHYAHRYYRYEDQATENNEDERADALANGVTDPGGHGLANGFDGQRHNGTNGRAEGSR